MNSKALRLNCYFLSVICTSLLGQETFSIDPPFQYPAPEGKYQVGTRFLTLTDTGRPDLFTEDADDFRQISLRIWYPAIPEPGTQPLSYYNEEVADNFMEMGFFQEAFKKDIALQASCSFRDAPILKTGERFPLVIYSSSGVMNANVFLFENLASHGYVVVSIGHPHWCLFYYDDKGNPYYPNYENDPHYQKMWEEEGSETVESLKEKITLAGSAGEKRKLIKELNKAMPSEISDVKMWVMDFDFVIGELNRQNTKGGIFQGILDLEKICITGYSKGGVAAAHACMSDNRCTAGINFSGFLFGDINKHPIKVPFLNIESEEEWCENCDPINDIIYHNAETDIFMIQVKGATHGNFTDLSAYKDYISEDFKGLLGSIEGGRFLRIQFDYVLSFLNKYLKDLPSPVPEELSGKYEEVLYKARAGT